MAWRGLGYLPRVVKGGAHLYNLLNSTGATRCGAVRCKGPSVRFLSRSSAVASSSSSDDSFPESADVVVIGGGAVGCSSLYHLAKEGLKVVLLEKDDLTSGTTWHSAAMLWRLRPVETEFLLNEITRSLAVDLKAKTDALTWIENGGLFIANNESRLDEYRRLRTIGRVYNVDSHILTPAEAKKVYPLLNVSDMVGALYSPTDGQLEPAGYCTALSKVANTMGGQTFTSCEVKGIETKVDDFGVRRVTGVRTASGLIKTTSVVCAAGSWAEHIASDLKIEHLPQLSMKHAYVLTEPIEGVAGLPNVRDHDGSMYLKTQGDSVGVGGYEPSPVFKQVPKDFSFSLYDLDYDVFGCNLEAAINRVPIIAETGIKSTVCGPESFTPDGHPLIGESGQIRGFYHCHGFNSGGLMMSGGAGKMIAQEIVQGAPELDMFPFNANRFNSKVVKDSTWLHHRTHEGYVKHYTTVFAHDEPLAGRNAITDPLHEILLEQGCMYQEKGGWERPGWFSNKGPVPKTLPYQYDTYVPGNTTNDPYRELLKDEYTFGFPPHHDQLAAECMACREGVSLFNMSYFGKMYISGPDAQAAVDIIFTNDMRKPAGSTVYTCMLNPLGGTESDLTVSIIDDSGPQTKYGVPSSSFYVAVGGSFSPYVKAHIQSVMQNRQLNCNITDLSEEMVLLSLQGRHSRSVLEEVTRGQVDLSNESFPFGSHQVIQVAGKEARLMRLSFVGELGWEVHAPADSAVHIYKALMEAGNQHGIRNAGYRAMDSLSIEKGYRHWHADVRCDDTPLEAGLGFTCKLDQDIDFIGRSKLEQQRAEGLTKRLACFTADENVCLNGLEAIKRDGEMVGYVRRAEYGFAIDKPIAYGYVKRPDGGKVTIKYLKEGSYTLERLGVDIPATFHPKPIFDPNNSRLQGKYD